MPKKKEKAEVGLTEGETRFIDSTISEYVNEESKFKGWVYVSLTPEKKLGTGPIEKVVKFQKRILVVGKYRIFLIERGTVRGKKSIDKNYHLFDINELSLPQGILLIKIDNVAGMLCIKSERVQDIVQAIRNSYQRISSGFGKYSMVISIPPENLLPIEELKPTPANGLIENYIAHCSYSYSRVSIGFIQFVEDICESKSVSIDLSQCPGIEPKTPITCDLNTIMNSLSLNTYFRALIIKNIQAPKLNLRSTLRFNSTLTKLIISNVDADINWIGIGEGLSNNKEHSIQFIEFSHVEINLRQFTSLCNAFQTFPHALKSLKMSHCSLGSKALTSLFESFEKNFSMSLTIEELDLSGNKFEESGSNAFGNWISKAREYSSLRKLILANASVSVNAIGPWLRNIPQLQHLDITGNRMSKEGSHLIRVLIDSSSSLSQLKVGSCKLTSEQVEDISMGMLRNSKINNIELDFSNNECTTFDFWKEVFAAKYNLQVLDLSGIRLKSPGILAVLKALSTFCITLTSLNIGKNLGGESGEEVAIAVGEFIEMNSNLKKLGLSGTKGSRFRQSIDPFFPYLSRNQSLEELDLEGNKMGDEVFLNLTQMLRANNTLKTLHFDDNDVTINGFMALLFLVRHNKKISNFRYPRKDLETLDNLPESKKKKLGKILEEIRFLIRYNAGTPDSSPLEDIPTTVAPLAQLPEHLSKFQTFQDLLNSKETLRPFRPFYEPELGSDPETVSAKETTDEEHKSDTEENEEEEEEEERVSLPPSTPKPSQSQISGERCIALYDYAPKESNELGFKENDTINILEKFENNDWYKGEMNGNIGFFPSNYVKPIRQVVVALCSFSATEPNELSFMEGDKINVIEKYEDSEWWKGELKGKVGFFPKNMCVDN